MIILNIYSFSSVIIGREYLVNLTTIFLSFNPPLSSKRIKKFKKHCIQRRHKIAKNHSVTFVNIP